MDKKDLSARGNQIAFNLVKDPLGNTQAIIAAGTDGIDTQFEHDYIIGAALMVLCGVLGGVRKVEGGPELLEYISDHLSSTFLLEGAGLKE